MVQYGSFLPKSHEGTATLAADPRTCLTVYIHALWQTPFLACLPKHPMHTGLNSGLRFVLNKSTLYMYNVLPRKYSVLLLSYT